MDSDDQGSGRVVETQRRQRSTSKDGAGEAAAVDDSIDRPAISSKNRAGGAQPEMKHNPLLRAFLTLMLAQIVMFAEAGAVPALLVQLTSSFKLTFPEQGYLGGIVYLGIAVGAPITSEFFKCLNPKNVLSMTLLINMVSLLSFGLVPSGWVGTLIGMRFLIGFTQATLSVYVPVWVDRFAPKEIATQWFSWLQITVPVGIMVGYVLGWVALGLQTAPDNGGLCLGGSVMCWRLPFFLQALLTIPVCCAIGSVPGENLDIEAVNRLRRHASQSDGSNGSPGIPVISGVYAYCCDVMAILRSFYFTTSVIVITSMYFVLMSIQYWATDYMIRGRSYPEHTTMLLFVLVSGTAPILGAILGGVLVDRMGGFEGSMSQRLKCTGVIFIFNCVGTAFAIATTYFPELGIGFVVMCLWFVLFFGGMGIPALTGMYTAAIPMPRLKILGSSIMLVTTNIFSYFLSPILAGYLMSRFSKEIPSCKNRLAGTCPQALEQGFRWSLFASAGAVFFMGIMWLGGCVLLGSSDSSDGSLGGTAEENRCLLEKEGGGEGYGGASSSRLQNAETESIA